MSEERVSEIKELLFNLERKIAPLEWDAGRDQINEFKRLELERLRTEHGKLSEELTGLDQ